MLNEFSRTELLIGRQALKKLGSSKIAVFGIGGVGSYVVEGLARAGIGKIVIIDKDNVDITNINRQLPATSKTIGRPKVEVMKERILEINPKAEVTAFQQFYLPETSVELINKDYDYIVDAVDTVTAKIDLVVKAKQNGIPVISCMGAGNKLDPTKFEVADIYKTSVCPLAKVMRQELRKRGIDSLKVVYSKESPIKPFEDESSSRRQTPGSISFVPSVAGLIIAGEVIKDLIGYNSLKS
ncbi:MAG: ThiF family adenylyltransferase [Deltaproteobacteria bacterium]